MDMTAVDISGINAKAGDEVIIFGEKHSIFIISENLKTIPYEVFTSISQRVKRVYLRI